ncbi:MAG: saccharopine dehydrogenase NADP-binding domain-containing protein [Clostridiales Family XIII bacterium]|jgi:saccharopine dehydrogenase-like NADP-dependent oxidoreductase|nr:saccharopine dehydrogenase NADP-binding domain-containing protein [Clostridiales Family XIII bacterium]
MGKKIVILGVGAQGSTVAQRMDEEAGVSEIVCADYDDKAVSELVKILKKGRGEKVNATDKASIVKAAQGADLIVNALPLEFGKNVLDAALEAGTGYQDFAAAEGIAETWEDGIRAMYRDYGPRFEKIGKTAVIGTGSAPGLICAATRHAVRRLDTCETIYNLVYEGLVAKRFLPFWWSPVTALSDMSEAAYAFEDGQITRPDSFSRPVYRKYDYMDEEVRFVEHAHDEPVMMGLNADKYFKGAKNIYFKYGGSGIEFAEPLYRAGMLSKEPEQLDGQTIIPFNFVLKHVPPAPKYRDEIRQILEEGLIADTGCMVVEAYGEKDGKKVRAETHVFAPGLEESFKRAGITAEMYLTGQGGALFTKMFVEGKYERTGLISSDMLSYDEVDYYFSCAAKLGITLEDRFETL